MKALVKWCGGKSKMAETILSMLPKGKRLVEPFVGSAAVSIASDFKHFYWNDKATPLVIMYSQVMVNPEDVGELLYAYLRVYGFTEKGYYQVRKEFNEGINDNTPLTAARMIYLNKTGFNGLFRLNSKGEFNVPWGKRTTALFPEMEELREFSYRFLGDNDKRNTILGNVDFTQLFRNNLRKGDVVYCDPPYVPLNENGFVGYSGGFGEFQQQQLADCAFEASRRGIPVLISNHDTPYTRKLYQLADEIKSFDVARAVNCKGDGRQKAKEIYALYKAK